MKALAVATGLLVSQSRADAARLVWQRSYCLLNLKACLWGGVLLRPCRAALHAVVQLLLPQAVLGCHLPQREGTAELDELEDELPPIFTYSACV